jgi:hypothetical protein
MARLDRATRSSSEPAFLQALCTTQPEPPVPLKEGGNLARCQFRRLMMDEVAEIMACRASRREKTR